MNHFDRHIRRKAVANYVDAGHSLMETADKFKVSYNYVLNACKENGVNISTVGIKLTTVDLFKILLFLVSGKSIQQIKNEFGITTCRLYQIRDDAKEAGWQLKT